MKVVVAADHRGFALKEDLRTYLAAQGHQIKDVGAFHHDPSDDYPDLAYPGALLIAKDPAALGVFVCGSGMGMDIVANKVKGVRATVVRSPEDARYARMHDDVNVATLAADDLDPDRAREVVDAFLSTAFSGEPRHARRLEKLRKIEEAR